MKSKNPTVPNISPPTPSTSSAFDSGSNQVRKIGLGHAILGARSVADRAFYAGVQRHNKWVAMSAEHLLNMMPSDAQFDVVKARAVVNVRVEAQKRKSTVSIPRFTFPFQGVLNPVVVDLELEGKSAWQTRAITKRAKRFLFSESRRDQGQYWERLNESMLRHLMSTDKGLTRVTSALRVDSAEAVPAIRTSILTLERHGDELKRSERFTYHMPRHQLAAFPGQPLDFDVEMDYVNDIEQIENFLNIHDFINSQLVSLPTPQAVEQRLRTLPAEVMKRFPFVCAAKINLTASPDVLAEGAEAPAQLKRRLGIESAR